MGMLSKSESDIWDSETIARSLQAIHFEQKRRELKILSIVSFLPKEGKTTVAMNLANGYSKVYSSKVLYVDLNPQGDILISQKLGDYHSQNGFVDNVDLGFTIFRIKDLSIDWSKSFFDSLFIGRLFETFKVDFDLVIIDSHCLVSKSDSGLNINADGYILVTSPESLSDKRINVLEYLNPESQKVLGVILNG